MKILYTTEAVVEGGRAGQGRTSDGRLAIQLSVPKELGGEGGPGTNPEQLFAVGYAVLPLRAAVGGPGSETRCFRLDGHRPGGDRSHRSRRIWLGGEPRPTRAEPGACRRRGPHAPSPRALSLLERHAWQCRRHAPRRRHIVK